jgi:hypothetical protein
MINLRQFQNEKNQLLTIYEDVLNNFELDENDIYELKQYQKNLLEERFIVSVCGQINVGKSTFLNDLLFEENLLPTKEVVETAKLTTITYGESPVYEVVFYSEEEWMKLKEEIIVNANGDIVKNDNGEPYTFYEYLIKPAINKIISLTGNISIEKEMIDMQSTSGTNFKDLKKYISANGIYTPFVKSVNLSYPSEILKDIIVVDTPGTNDPNTVRSKLTEDWIGKSDAVIYLMYAAQALTSQDQEFILKYLLPVPSDKIMIALSKIDTVDNYQRPKNYLENNLRKLEQFQRAIEHKTIYPISPMYSLYPKIYKKYEAGEISLSESEIDEIEFQLFDRRDEKIEKIITAKGFMPEFREAIETHLLANKGKALLISHKQKIVSIFDIKLQDLIIKKEGDYKKLSLSQLSSKDILEKEEELNNYINNIKTVEDDSKRKRDIQFRKLEDSIHESLIQMFDYIGTEMKREIRTSSLDHLIHNIGWFLKNECEQFIYYGEFKQNITNSLKKFKAELEDLLNTIKNQVTTLNIISTVSIDAMFSDIAYKPITKGLEQKVTNKLNSDILKQLENKLLFIRIKQKQTLAEIEGVVNELINTDEANGLRESIFAIILSNVQGDLNKFFESLLNQIKEGLVSVKEHLRVVLDEKEEKGTLEKKIKKQINDLELKIQSLEKQKSLILGNLNLVK